MQLDDAIAALQALQTVSGTDLPGRLRRLGITGEDVLRLLEATFVSTGPLPLRGTELVTCLRTAARVIACLDLGDAVLDRVLWPGETTPADQELVALLQRTVSSDAFESAVLDALDGSDLRRAARALGIQYFAWNFGSSLQLSREGRERLLASVARLEALSDPPPALAAALATYVPPG